MSFKHPQTDLEVLKDSVKNPWVFGMLVDRYQEAFLRKASYILRSKELAEDAVQDTFLKIYKNAEKFSPQTGASFSSWAYRILTNTCYSYLERKVADSGRTQHLALGDLDGLEGEEVIIGSENTSLVQSILARMPRRLSRLLSLYFLEDKSYEEISRAEQISLSAVKSGLHRARKQFKDVAIEMI